MDEKGLLGRLFRSDFITVAKRQPAQSSGEVRRVVRPCCKTRI